MDKEKNIYVNKDVLILTQVALKAFIEAHKRLPEAQDWRVIRALVQEIWANSRVSVKELENLVEEEERITGEKYKVERGIIKAKPGNAEALKNELGIVINDIPF